MKITEKHFKIFKKEGQKWIDIFGLKNWSIHFKVESQLGDSYASFSANRPGKIATIFLEKDWKDDEVTTDQLKRAAFHEVIEILLSDMGALASSRYFDQDEFDTAKHSVIRILENTVWSGNENSKTSKTKEI